MSKAFTTFYKAIAFLLWIFTAKVVAHPHMYVDAKGTLVFDNVGLVAIDQVWRLDEMFSAALMGTFDTDKDSKLSTAEAKRLQAEAFDNLRNYSYFTHLVQGTSFTTIGPAEQFSAVYEESRIVYRFRIPLTVPSSKDHQMLLLAVFDPSAYVGLTMDLNTLQVKTPKNIEAEHFVDEINSLKLFKGLLAQQKGLYIRFRQKL